MQNLTVSHVFSLIKERHGLKSDYQVCGMLDLSTALVSGWRNGRTLPDERMCQKLAVAAGIDPLVLAASMQAQRSKTEEARTMWQAVAERLQMAAQGAVAAIFAVVVAMGFVADDAYAQSAAEVHAPAAEGAKRLYIVSSGYSFVEQRSALRSLDSHSFATSSIASTAFTQSAGSTLGLAF